MITNKIRILFNKFILGSPKSQIPNPLGFSWSKKVKKHILEGKKVSHTSFRSFAIQYVSVLLYFFPLVLVCLCLACSQTFHSTLSSLYACPCLPESSPKISLSLSHSHTHKHTLAVRS